MLLRNTLVCGLVCGLLGSAGFAGEARLEETLPDADETAAVASTVGAAI